MNPRHAKMRVGTILNLVLLSVLGVASQHASAVERVAIFVDGIDRTRSLLQVGAQALPGGQRAVSALVGPLGTRTSNYLLKESVIPQLIRASIPEQKEVLWNGDLTDAQATRNAVVNLQSLICQQRGKSVDLITHSLGSVIAYAALAELAGVAGNRAVPACDSSTISSFITLASPLGADDFLPRVGGPVFSGIPIPNNRDLKSARRLRIQGRWLNVFAVGDMIGGKINMPGVVNVSFSLQQVSLNEAVTQEAHNFPWRDADSARLLADVILGAHVRSEVLAASQTAPPPAASIANAPLKSLGELTTAGLGAAAFGMSFESVERALGLTLPLPSETPRAKVNAAGCLQVKPKEAPGTELVFERGRFIAVELDQPTISTRSGFKVGDPERLVIDRLKSDPTFRQQTGRYSEAVHEVIVGSGALDGTGSGAAGRGRGRNMRLYSEQGRVKFISAGEAGFVLMDEREVTGEESC